MRRRLWVAGVSLLLLVAATLGVVAAVRWSAAGIAHPISPPLGAGPWIPPGGPYERVVSDRASIIQRRLRNDRGPATVRIYLLPPDSPWLQSKKIVATQLDHWDQDGDCADNPAARILECSWREPTRWWPRTVQLTMLRPPPDGPSATIVIIGSAPGD